MAYERIIKYLEYRVNGEKRSVAGFLQAEWYGKREFPECLSVHITGPASLGTGSGKIIIVGAGKEVSLGEIRWVNGTGKWTLRDEKEMIGEKGSLCEAGLLGEAERREKDYELTWGLVESMYIRISDHEEIYGDLGSERKKMIESTGRDFPTTERITENVDLSEQPEPVTVGGEYTEESENGKESDGRSDTKWQQLCKLYPAIHPFRDSVEYLSLSIGDFVILSEKYFELSHNSFLLHGYHNYRQLVLCRRDNGKTGYYLGVPGIYHEKERQAAKYFGFEGFEGAKAPATCGDFGYYMISVEL